MGWLSKIVPGVSPEGAPILSVLGKQTYLIRNGCAAVPDSDRAIPFHESDEYYGNGSPQSGALKAESDLAACKPLTDVIIDADACCPVGKRAYHLDVCVQVASFKKTIRVFGNRRVFLSPGKINFTRPEPFERMPLNYTLSYGGMDSRSDTGASYTYPRNPVGKGFIIKKSPSALQDLVLPNLEDPSHLLAPGSLILKDFRSWPESPNPVSFGCTSRHFYPRHTYAGLPPDLYVENETARQLALQEMPEIGTPAAPPPLPYVPMLNPLFFNCAPPGLQFPYLRGDEPISLTGMDPELSRFNFTLPGVRPWAWINIGKGRQQMKMVLHTVEISKHTNQAALVWRGCAYYGGPNAMEKFQQLDFGVSDAGPSG